MRSAVANLYPAIEPHDQGMLAVGDGNEVHWEVSGTASGKPALVLHGGPGSGCTPWHRRLFDPGRYRTVLLDQRGAGASTPHASDPDVDLSANTTAHLIADCELLRERLGIDRWLLLGGSWGSTLALAYAEQHPERITEIVLFGVTSGARREADWLFREGLGEMFPEQWERRRTALPPELRGGDVVEGYAQLLFDPDPAVREHAAYEWCMWESATPDWPPRTGLLPRFEDPRFRLAFARLVTHYVSHDEFLADGALWRGLDRLAGIPAVLINGRYDMQAPLRTAWELDRAWALAELVVVDGAGHSAGGGIAEEIVRATDRFAS